MTSPLAPPFPPPTVIRLDELGELIAGIPGLLGFHPTDSLVLVTFSHADGYRIGPTVRIDLPDPADGRDLVHQLCGALDQNDVVATAVVVVGGGDADPPDLPHRELARILTEELSGLGIRLVHSAWVPLIARDATWWCYEEEECTGQVHDPRTSTLAVLQTIDGSVTYPSRADMAALLAPDHEDRVAHRADLLAALADSDPHPDDLTADVLAAVEATTSRASPAIDDERLVRLGAALCHAQVRDTCLALSITEWALPAERLWLVLTRSMPVPERAEPAFLLALCAYLRGAAVLAGMALEVAMDADPDHRLAPLLREALDRGTPPDVLRTMLGKSIERAHTRTEPTRDVPDN
ncbi:DUF4192 domain-containing protein [Actinophytocola gossypii]|uniref:DUF4192 domain-containing protein n=1 Tax=Actinophytocola gossypii TaxID=2812003 RepID=A0ABT2J840_9PSEU|nr:DUF4192 domain-containing protein [Actinophytocola gossypii]MCT2584017.1 DUF4192 domain-containing protein [Actinophytocola gossypii]